MIQRMTSFTAAAAAGLLTFPAIAQDEATLTLAEAETVGEYVAGPDGMPVYAFTTDTQSDGEEPAISCTSQDCLEAWPLVTVDGEPSVGDGLDSALAGTMNYDGQTVVTYNGWPLYTFVRDETGQPPQGNHVESFGGEWYLLNAAGEHVEAGGD